MFLIHYFSENFHLKTLPLDLINMAVPLVVMNAFFIMVGIDLKLTVLLLCMSTYFIISHLKSIKLSKIDVLVIFYLLHLLFTRSINSYHFELFYNGMRYEFWAVLFFFLGRMPSFSSSKLFENMQYFVLFACVIGIGLYVKNPGWYAQFRYGNLNAYDALDYFRFSAFWKHSYAISYLGCLTNLYCIKCIIKKEHVSFSFICYLITFIAVLLSQQRVAIFAILIGAFFLNYLGLKKMSANYKCYLIIFDVIAVIFLAISILSYLNSIDSRTLWYIKEKIDSMVNMKELVSNRFGMYDAWIDSGFPILGDGLGRYSHPAVGLHLPVITDCEYVKIIFEKGVYGLLLFGLIQIVTLFRAWRCRVQMSYELSVCIFYLIAMIGADPLSLDLMQPWFFWFCVGRIHNKDVLKVS